MRGSFAFLPPNGGPTILEMVEMVEMGKVNDHLFSPHSRRLMQCRICKQAADRHAGSEEAYVSLWRSACFPLVTPRMEGFSGRTLGVLKAVADMGGRPDAWDLNNRGWHKTAVSILIKDEILVKVNDGEAPGQYALSEVGRQLCGWHGYTITALLPARTDYLTGEEVAALDVEYVCANGQCRTCKACLLVMARVEADDPYGCKVTVGGQPNVGTPDAPVARAAWPVKTQRETGQRHAELRDEAEPLNAAVRAIAQIVTVGTTLIISGGDDVRSYVVQSIVDDTYTVTGTDGMVANLSAKSLATWKLNGMMDIKAVPVMIVHAASGEVITDGMAVWDNNLDLGIVDLATLTSDGWFNVSTPDGERGSLMNGERVTTRHPFTGVLAADALNAAVEVSTVTTSTVESVAVLEGIQAAQDARMDDTERWFDQVVAISEQTIAAEGACLPDGCTAGYRHEPSYEFVISSHNNIDYATCQCGQFIQGNREAGYRLRADVVTEREIARADKIAAGMPKVGDWLHNDTAGVTGRVVLINAHGRITLDTGDGHTRSAHWDVLSGEGFEHVPSSPAADRLMAEGEIESTVGPVYGGRRMEEITSYLLACGMDPADWDVEGLSDEIGRQSGPVSIDALPVDVWFALIRQFEMPAPVAPVAPVARVLSKPSATKVNRRKRKATRASRRRTGGRA